jgi:hypothetical protein
MEKSLMIATISFCGETALRFAAGHAIALFGRVFPNGKLPAARWRTVTYFSRGSGPFPMMRKII